MNKIILILISLTLTSCFYSSSNGKSRYGVEKGDVYLTKNGVYIHKNMNDLQVGAAFVDDSFVKNHPSYIKLKVNSEITVSKILTQGNWPMTSSTEVYGDVRIGGKTYRNVNCESVFIDPERGFEISARYVHKKK